MTINRRAFLGTSAALAVAPPSRWRLSPLGRPGRSVLGVPFAGEAPTGVITLRDPQVKALALAALDAAKSEGVTYADVRVTYTTSRQCGKGDPAFYEVSIGLSVRALVHGYWGWAATPYLSQQEGPRVGREAARLAKLGASKGRPRTVQWGTLPATPDGTWQTPIRIDPFDVPIEEISDFCGGVELFIENQIRPRKGEGGDNRCGVGFRKQERILASTEGNYCTQTVYTTGFAGGFHYTVPRRDPQFVDLSLVEAQGGWEYVLDAQSQIFERIQSELDRLDYAPPRLPFRARLAAGFYDIVFAAPAVSAILAKTLVPATELDRAVGYEANIDGTSYLGPDPLTRLGTQITSPLITLTADRSNPRGLTTVRWDDDGVTPEDFTLIKDGILVDYQTNREQAPWLAPWYQKQGKTVRSHGCAAAADALTYPMQTTPNMTLHPGTAPLGVEELIAQMDTGLLIDNVGVDIDFQCANGLGTFGGMPGAVYEIRQGRRVGVYASIELGQLGSHTFKFRTADLWKNVLGIGGTNSVKHIIADGHKGEPRQEYLYSVSAVPMLVKQILVLGV